MMSVTLPECCRSFSCWGRALLHGTMPMSRRRSIPFPIPPKEPLCPERQTSRGLPRSGRKQQMTTERQPRQAEPACDEPVPFVLLFGEPIEEVPGAARTTKRTDVGNETTEDE